MNEQKIGDLMETIIPKEDKVWGDEVDLIHGKRKVGIGRILVILSTGGALMKVIVEIVQWFGGGK